MHILYISSFLPHPPYSGGRTRLSQFVSYLAQKHHITIACLRKLDEEVDTSWYDKRGIEIIHHSKLSLLTIPSIAQSVKFGSVYAGANFSEELRESIESLLSSRLVDLIHVVCSYILRTLPEKLNAPLIVEEPNLESVVLRQYSEVVRQPLLKWLYLLEANQLEAMQLHGLRVSSRYICTSPTDIATIRFLGDHDKVRVVPNGVDTDSYSFEFAAKSSQPLLVFLANFNYFPNTDAINFFVKHIFPKILSKIPDVRLRILGYHADIKLRHLQDSANVEICGYKPDIRADIAEGWIFICPLRSGSGSRIKILESMALGTPVVSTSIGCAGLPVENGRNIVVAENNSMAESIIELVSKPDYRKSIALSARWLVESQMTWERSVEHLDNIYSEVVPVKQDAITKSPRSSIADASR